jgi:CubicO group peptidase (beta-lactamase class C family)
MRARLLRRREVIGGLLAAPVAARAQPDGDAELRSILAERIDVARQSVGIVAAVLEDSGQRLIAYGRSDTPDDRALDSDSVFEIGSITKVFTALLLADMVRRGEAALDQPVAELLPAGTIVPQHERPITLLDLATYSSGLPREPSNIALDRRNPYARYSAERMYAFLASYALPYVPGQHYEYANLGFALLGHALALRAARPYEDLVVERICAPLGLDDTRITLTASMRARLVQGHDAALFPTPGWDMQVYAGTGALHSTARDMGAFVAACAGWRSTPLDPAIAGLLATRRPGPGPTTQVALGWFIASRHGDEIVWKDGSTGGASSFIGYSTHERRGAVVLSSAGYWNDVNDIGLHLVNPAFPLRVQRQTAAVAPERLAALVGTYRMTPTLALTVTRLGTRLFAEGSGRPVFEIFPASETEFFYRRFGLQLTFELGADGRAAAVVMRARSGGTLRGTRITLGE